MRWINIKREELVGLECINPKNDKHILRLSPNSKNMIQDEQDNNDTRIVSIIVNNKPSIDDIKKYLLSLQKEYDSSLEVNCFILSGKKVWLDKSTRVGLFNLLTMEKASNTKITTLWFKTVPIEIEVDKAITLLTAVEKYAKQCYDNTQKHYAEINQLTSIEACLQYDITAGYPAILNIQI